MTNKPKKSLIFIIAIALALTLTTSIIAYTTGNVSYANDEPCVYAEDETRECAARPLTTGKIVVEQSTRRILYGENETARLYPASTTKILTALVVLESLPLETKIKIDDRAVGIEGSSIYLRAGETLTVEDLLFGMMLRSGNDSAVALALAVSPTIDAFAKKMNMKAVECGAKNSNFVNPHGLHDENHFTTASDLALITAAAMDNADFRRIVSAKRTKIGEGESARIIANKNKMLSLFEGANGVKTGFTKSSGRCLVSSAEREGMTLISVVLNCPDMWRDSAAILEKSFDEYEMTDIEKGLVNFSATTEIKLDLKLDENGDFLPKKYPMRKDGSEKISFIGG